MTLTDAKILFDKRRIPYRTVRYENEADYWRHLMSCPRTDSARNCKITALVIPSVNGVKDIELQFSRLRREFVFDELWFGCYSFDMYDYDQDLLEADLMDIIGQIVDGKVTVISASDLKKKRWISDARFDPTDCDNVFGAPGCREALAKIEKPRTFWQKLAGRRIQYDIYDWRSYRQVIK